MEHIDILQMKTAYKLLWQCHHQTSFQSHFIEILRVIRYSSGIEIYSPPMTADFSQQSFMPFLKDLIPKCIQNDEEVILLMEDFMFVDNAILDARNSLMASGEIAGLFPQT